MEHIYSTFISTVGGIVSRGLQVDLTFTEAQAVLPEGRISRQDCCSDERMKPFREVIEVVYSQNQKIGIQIAHAEENHRQ